MNLTAVSRRSVPDEVYEQLVTEVIDGRFEAGGELPSERRLAEVLGVSRPAVREALQRLAYAGLVDVRQGDATRVRDYRRTAGLDLLPRLLFAGGRVELAVVRSIMEARQLVGPRVAELAAERGGAAMTGPLGKRVDALAAADEPVERQRRALAFWELLVDGADSITYRLMFNSLRAAYVPALDALSALLADEVEHVAAYRGVAEAVGAGRGTLARRRADALLRRGHDRILAALESLEADR